MSTEAVPKKRGRPKKAASVAVDQAQAQAQKGNDLLEKLGADNGSASLTKQKLQSAATKSGFEANKLSSSSSSSSSSASSSQTAAISALGPRTTTSRAKASTAKAPKVASTASSKAVAVTEEGSEIPVVPQVKAPTATTARKRTVKPAPPVVEETSSSSSFTTTATKLKQARTRVSQTAENIQPLTSPSTEQIVGSVTKRDSATQSGRPVSEILRLANAFVRDSRTLNDDFSHLLTHRETLHVLWKQELEQSTSQAEKGGLKHPEAHVSPATDLNTAQKDIAVDSLPSAPHSHLRSETTETVSALLSTSTTDTSSKASTPPIEEQQQYSKQPPKYAFKPPPSSMPFYQPPIDFHTRPKYTLPYSTTTALKARNASQSQIQSQRAPLRPPPPATTTRSTAPPASSSAPPSQPHANPDTYYQHTPGNTGGKRPLRATEMSAAQLKHDPKYRSLKNRYLRLMLALPVVVVSTWFLAKKIQEQRGYEAERRRGNIGLGVGRRGDEAVTVAVPATVPIAPAVREVMEQTAVDESSGLQSKVDGERPKGDVQPAIGVQEKTQDGRTRRLLEE